MSLRAFQLIASLTVACYLSGNAIEAQSIDRLPGVIGLDDPVRMNGTVDPGISAAVDEGNAESHMTLHGLTLNIAPSHSQQSDLDALISEQQTPGSKVYQKWLAFTIANRSISWSIGRNSWMWWGWKSISADPTSYNHDSWKLRCHGYWRRFSYIHDHVESGNKRNRSVDSQSKL